ncbi:MAG: hypothetical protein Rhims3KO_15170 [Hyphomicrobiales bacterium]
MNGGIEPKRSAPGETTKSEAVKVMLTRWLPILVCLALALPIFGHSTRAPAQTSSGPMSGEITAACMEAMDESQAICACIEEEAAATLSEDEQTFLLAIMTEDETLLDDLRGNFTSEDAQIVQNQMIASAMQCMG